MRAIAEFEQLQDQFSRLNHTLCHFMQVGSSDELVAQYAKRGWHTRNVPCRLGARQDGYWWNKFDWHVDGEADSRWFLEVAAAAAAALSDDPPSEWLKLMPGTMEEALGTTSRLYYADYWVLAVHCLAWGSHLPYDPKVEYQVGTSSEDRHFCFTSELPVDIAKASQDAMILLVEAAPELEWDRQRRTYVSKPARTARGGGKGGVRDPKKWCEKDDELAALGRKHPEVEDDGTWVSNKKAADIEKLRKDTLRKYRAKGRVSGDGRFGVDIHGRLWRRRGSTPGGHPWYPHETLRPFDGAKRTKKRS